ncbi:Zinc finger, CCCH-type [Quillaja saponaria]|uniref:Zinc finger, CCCH-type n=1 Tax=Quillaja saponaria TaxID=32244 RepID=A0AAD7LW89_QUISA|nr:Zinc finger, CCCH-type [Quillaja saponaria]KAJ7965497.1 Zinc finger, CCCH-type [Quillaja saponaria]
MDHPSHFLNHSPRYVPRPLHPQPQPRNPQFVDDPKFHNPHPRHLPQPSATALPPQRPPSYRTLLTPPPPRPYNPHQSQFAFSTQNYAHLPDEEERSRSSHHPHNFTQSYRVSDRIPVDDGNSHHRLPESDHSYREIRPENWDPSMVLPEDRVARTYPRVDFDMELRQRPLDHQSMSPYHPIDKFRHDSEGSSRLRMELNDGFQSARERFVWGRADDNYNHRVDFVSNPDISARDFGFVSNQNILLRDLKPHSGNYDHWRGPLDDNEISRGSRRAGIFENKRWVHDRKTSIGVQESSFELGNNKIIEGDGARVISGKREYYGPDSGRHNNRGNREGSHEFTRTPRKQVQKKSAFLRIQMVKPNHRNRESEQLHFAGYFDDSNSNSFKGKDQLGSSGYGMETKEREGSPVELDISFKSNALVAKAIVAPSSSAIVSDTVTPSCKKSRKVLASDNDCSNSELSTNLFMRKINLDGSPHVKSNISSSDKDLKKLPEKVCDSSPQPCSNGTNIVDGKGKVEQFPKGSDSDKVIDVGSNKTSSLKVAKKKKIVKKVVKKVVNPQSRVSSSQSAKFRVEPVKADNSSRSPISTSCSDKNVTPLKEKNTTADKVSVPDPDLQSSPNEVNVLPEIKKVAVSPLTSALEKCVTDNYSVREQVSGIKENGKISNSSLNTSNNTENKIVSAYQNAEKSVYGLHSISNFDRSSNESLDGSDIGNMEDGKKQLCQTEVLLSHKNDAEEGCQDNMYHVVDNMSSGLLSSDEIKTNADLTNICNSAEGKVSGLSFDNVKSVEKITLHEISNNDIISKQSCVNQVSEVPQSGILEVIPKTVNSSQLSEVVGFSGSGDTRNDYGPKDAECRNHDGVPYQGCGNAFISSYENVSLPNSETTIDAGARLSLLGMSVSHEDSATERSLNNMVSVGCIDRNGNMFKKRKVRTQLDFSSSKMKDISTMPVDLASHANSVDTNSSLSLKGFSSAEVSEPIVESSDLRLQSGMDEASILHDVSAAKFSVGSDVNDGPTGAPPISKKKKISTPQSLTNLSPTELENNDKVLTSSWAEVPISYADGSVHHKEEVAASSVVALCTTALKCCPETVLLGNCFHGPLDSMDANREPYGSESLKLEHPTNSTSILGDAVIPNFHSPGFPMSCEQKDNGASVVAVNDTQKDVMVTETSGREKMDVHAAEDQIVIPSADLESDYLIVKDDLPPEMNCPSFPADGDGGSVSNSNDELVESLPDALSDMGSPENISEVPARQFLPHKASLPEIPSEKIGGDDEKPDRRSIIEDGSDLPVHTSSPQYVKINMESDLATKCDNSVTGKTIPLPFQGPSKNETQGMSSYSEVNGVKSQPNRVISKTFQGHSSFALSTSVRPASSTHVTKPRTWHRNDNISAPSAAGKKPSGTIPPKRKMSEKNRNFQSTSYIRKGNSLLRKPAPVVALPQGSSTSQLSSLGTDDNDSQKRTRSEGRVDVKDQPPLLRTAGTNSPLERPRTPPLPLGTKLPNRTATFSGDHTCSSLAEPLSFGCNESTPDHTKLTETNDAPNSAEDVVRSFETHENQIGTSNELESHTEVSDGSLSSLNMKRIVYVKRKLNQLVATSNTSHPSISNSDKIQAVPSDGYYKRRKNQLIRTNLEGHINQTVVMPDNIFNSDPQNAPKVVCSRRFGKRQSNRVATRSSKPLKASLVWTLRSTDPSKGNSDSLGQQKFLPHLFPWKRATYRRSSIHSPSSHSSSSSLSTVSKKLLLLRKRDTVYTRSTHGYSLRKSKVLSVGGSSLKWSKSIETRSKKANEEATLAVAAEERKKREQKDAVCSRSGTRNRKHLPRERIFRIGSVRYKMDSSRRTLQRISDDESPSSASVQLDKDAKRSYIPKRLVIGNDEYIRIGNGNQLVRDPKKRTRVLASEKVRWSLHTARLRLARKRKYCQFFTRFGKCNKDDGKCLYLHDPSKIAVCTKFLNGLCFNPSCKLTHKVIPERMPDCSFFLQGLCTNRNCPYRHVNVNPKASTCEGFLRGYCADGNECRKKHSYVCPTFEATGTCPQGTNCKLHHPKNQSKGKKRKRSGDQKNTRGRYFGSMHVDVSEPGIIVGPKPSEQDNDNISLEGKLADYISLNVGDEEVGESLNLTCQQTTFRDIDPSDSELENLDDLIKPVLIMKENFTA